MKNKKTSRITRHKRIRAKVRGSESVPRISVFRSNKHTYAQAIDDESGKTLFSASDATADSKGKKVDLAKKVGEQIAKIAKEKNIKKAVFDRSGYQYHGRVKAVADGAREGGLEF